jgi:hypothetical protein
MKTIKEELADNLNERENSYQKDNKSFEITSICREDMQSIGFDTTTLSDDDMKIIASKMADHFLECCYWQNLESILIDLYDLKQGDM